MESLRSSAGFFGPNLLSDITLVVQILFYLVLSAGVVAQLQANYKWHDRLQIPVVVLNIFFIFFVMIPAFSSVAGRLPSGISEVPTLVTTVHAFLGIIAQGLALYCLLAGLKILPRKIGVLRYWMWATYGAWTATVIFGISVYILFYTGASASSGAESEHSADMVTEPATEVAVEAEATPAEVVAEHDEAPVIAEQEATPTEVVAPTEVVEEHAEEAPAEVPTPTAEAAAPPVGIITFSDGDVHSDRVTLQMSGVPAPENGMVYEAWLQGPDEPPLSIGVVQVDGDIINYSYTDPDGRLLLDVYNGAFITVESANDNDPAPSDIVVYAGEVPLEVMQHVRHVVTAFPGSPDGDGLAFNALAEQGIMLLQIEAQQQSVDQDDLVNLKIHAETALNILEGENSPEYGDRDGDGDIYNPGDTFGLLAYGDSTGYLRGAADHANLAREAEGASPTVALHAGHVEIAAANAINWISRLREAENAILALEDAAAGAELMAEIARLADAALNGVDVNGDGTIAPVPDEGGIRTMYEHGQLMGTIELYPVAASPEPAPAEPELVDEHSAEISEVVEPEISVANIAANWQQLEAATAGPGARHQHAMQYNPATNQIFVFGGNNGSQDLNDVWVLSLADGNWRQIAANAPVKPPARHTPVMIVDEAGQRLTIAAGQGSRGVLNDVWQLDVASESWSDLTASAGQGPTARYGSPGGNVGNNLVLTHGFGGGTRYNDTWQLNTGSGQWENLTPASGELPVNRCLFAATTLAESLVIHGGCASGFGPCPLDDAWVLDTVSGSWRQVASELKPVARQHQTITNVAGEPQVMLFGGQDASRSALDDLWLLDLATDRWQPVTASAGPAGRYGHGAVWVSGQGMLLYGGRNSGMLDDVWLLALEGLPDTSPVAPAATPVPQPTATAVPQPTATPTVELVSEHDGE